MMAISSVKAEQSELMLHPLLLVKNAAGISTYGVTRRLSSEKS